mgnify:CR=1 FL=1
MRQFVCLNTAMMFLFSCFRKIASVTNSQSSDRFDNETCLALLSQGIARSSLSRFPFERMIARSMTFLSSLILPGEVYLFKSSSWCWVGLVTKDHAPVLYKYCLETESIRVQYPYTLTQWRYYNEENA